MNGEIISNCIGIGRDFKNKISRKITKFGANIHGQHS